MNRDTMLLSCGCWISCSCPRPSMEGSQINITDNDEGFPTCLPGEFVAE